MVLSLIRINESPNETTGILLIGGKPFCGTLEPPTVPNATHPKGAIPVQTDTHQVSQVRSRATAGQLCTLLRGHPHSCRQ